MGCYPNLVVTILVNIIINHSLLACAHTPFCLNQGIFLKNSTYATNLKQIIPSLSSNISLNGHFSNITAGEGHDKIYALAQCKGDLPSSNCYDCITSASKAIETRCPNEREAILWGDRDECMLRYANRDIFGRVELEPSYELSNPNNISIDSSVYNATLYGLVGKLSEQASLGSTKKFAVGSTRDNQSMYAMVQCTPDLSSEDCKVCLQSALDGVSNCCGRKEGGRFFQPSCFVWFELFQFYDSSDTTYDVSLSPPLGLSPTAMSIPSPQPNIQGKKSSSCWRVIVIVIIVAFVTLISIGCAILLYGRSRKEVHDPNRINNLESLQFDLQEIKDATNNFSDDNKLGHGGFGSVYKGRLSNGKEIAVKRLNRHSTQGEEEFSNEVSLVAMLQHRNLVSLLGFCSEANERILVYELLGDSLDHIIFDPIKRLDLKWEIRYKIICGIARGMLYLHEDSRHKVVHRDLKASNVLVDENMNPKISDFGMARLFQLDQSEANTRRHMGTYGYMAPEYAIHGRFSAKSDVFSFGVLVLEIISSKKNSWWDSSADVVHLLSYAWKSWREGTTTNLIDPMLDESSTSEIMRCIQIGLLCVQEDMEHRPTMASTILMLNSPSITLPLPLRPGFYMYNNSTMATRPNISEETESDRSTSTSRTLYVSTS